MNAEEIYQRVLREIGERTTNRFGWDFRPFLLSPPQLRAYAGDMLWTVLIESRSGASGYHVVYDPSADEFGIATNAALISLHGSLMAALDAL